MAPTNSTTATMAMGDALAMVMLDALKFDVSSYAMNHPAGAIGRALVMKTTDIMRTGDRMAKVSPGATVMDALMAMTKAKCGAAVVEGSDGALAGIFTDGDFRRVVSTGGRETGSGELGAEAVLSQPVSRYMTKTPLFVREDAYASELLKVFERRRIDDLPVCGADGKIVGLVDIQDLPKMKVL
jgi:arabinose-5-phosphate isomerase